MPWTSVAARDRPGPGVLEPMRLRRNAPLPVLAALVVSGSCGSGTGGAREPSPQGRELESSDLCGIPALPIVPVGLDAYRQWERWPVIRLGTRAFMRSTHDRAGRNHAADASHFLRQESDAFNVVLDVAGPGTLYFVRTNRWHGSPWHYVVDGIDNVVGESATADPTDPVQNSVFLPSAPFPPGLTATWSTSKGSDLTWVPMTFEQSLTLAYGRTYFGTGYFIFHAYPEGATNLSRPLESWDLSTIPTQDVLDLLASAGQDIAPTGAGVTELTGAVTLPASGAVTLAHVVDGGPQTVRALKLTVARSDAVAFGRASLRVTWDDRAQPSIDAPVALLFGTGTLYNRDGREFLVKGLPAVVRFDPADVELALYFPMPFKRSARVELVAEDPVSRPAPGPPAPVVPIENVRWELRTVPATEPPGWMGYFHATYRDHGTPVLGQDLVVLDTTQTEGGGDWCGSFVGMSWIFSEQAELTTLEGDPRIFLDDAAGPQGYGTGTEEWGGGGNYWSGQRSTLPLVGHPVGAVSPAQSQGPEDEIESAYRFLLADLFPFGKNARVHLEHGGLNDSTEHYRSVAYWYGLPGACLRLTDGLHVSDVADEAAHDYVSPDASAPFVLTSRYELGPDAVQGQPIIPLSTDTGRTTTTSTEMTFAIDPENVGVLLRRKLDYGYPDQRADVFVADVAPPGGPPATFQPAGTWLTAGSNRCNFSWPASGELGASEQHLETVNRRFRDDEMLLPPQLTRGRSAIRVRFVFRPVGKPVYPGLALAPEAWSELRYSVYSYVLPRSEHVRRAPGGPSPP